MKKSELRKMIKEELLQQFQGFDDSFLLKTLIKLIQIKQKVKIKNLKDHKYIYDQLKAIVKNFNENYEFRKINKQLYYLYKNQAYKLPIFNELDRDEQQSIQYWCKRLKELLQNIRDTSLRQTSYDKQDINISQIKKICQEHLKSSKLSKLKQWQDLGLGDNVMYILEVKSKSPYVYITVGLMFDIRITRLPIVAIKYTVNVYKEDIKKSEVVQQPLSKSRFLDFMKDSDMELFMDTVDLLKKIDLVFKLDKHFRRVSFWKKLFKNAK